MSWLRSGALWEGMTRWAAWVLRRRSVVAGAALGLGLLVFLQGGRPATEVHPILRADWLPVLVIWVPALVLAGVMQGRRNRDEPSVPASAASRALLVLAGLLGVYLFTSAAGNPWFYFFRWAPGGEGIGFGKAHLVRWCVAGAVLTPLFLVRRLPPWVPMAAAATLCSLVCMRAFLEATQGLPPYRDDHPSFMFRLWTLGQTLPHLAHYNPYWNGGRADAFALASGAVAPGALLWPLWRWAPVHEVYGPGLLILFTVLVPVIACLSVRVAGGGWTAGLCAAVLSLAVSRNVFHWLLHFGTLGFSLAVVFLMPISACLYRVLWRGGTDARIGVLLVLSLLLFAAWPAGAVMALPVAVAVGMSLRQLNRASFLFLACCGLAALLLYAPYAATFLRQTAAVGLIQSSGASALSEHWASEGLERLRDQLRRGSPLLLFLGVAGAVVLPMRGSRVFFGVLLAGMAILAGWGESLLPGLGLDRADLALFYVAVLPASLGIAHLLRDRRAWTAPARAAVFALVVISGLNASRFYGNQAAPQYHVSRDYMEPFVDWLREETPSNARILFAGQTIHAYGGGHVAYLPVLTGREMMACDYYAFSPKLVEPEYPPAAYRESPERIFEFLDLYNVGHVVTYHANWIRFFEGVPSLYERVGEFGESIRYQVFRVNRAPQPFLEGSGEVVASLNHLVVTLDDPLQPAVLKYNWADGLEGEAGVELYPVPVADGIRFIGLRGSGDATVRIRYRNPIFKRLFRPFRGNRAGNFRSSPLSQAVRLGRKPCREPGIPEAPFKRG